MTSFRIMPAYEVVYSCTGVKTANKPFHPTLSHLCRTLLLTNYNCYSPLPFVLHLPSLPSYSIPCHSPPTSSPITLFHFITHQVVAHMMPDLPNVGFERDLEGFIVRVIFNPLNGMNQFCALCIVFRSSLRTLPFEQMG